MVKFLIRLLVISMVAVVALAACAPDAPSTPRTLTQAPEPEAPAITPENSGGGQNRVRPQFLNSYATW